MNDVSDLNADKYKNINIDGIMKILPHRYPLLLVDRIITITPHDSNKSEGGSIIAYKNVTINEEIFLGHFPKEPIYPGVMIIEGMAQAGGVLAFVSAFGPDVNPDSKIMYFMTIDNVKFRIPVRPGDRLEYRMKVIATRSNTWKLRGEAYVDDKLVCEANLMAMLTDRHT